MLRPFWNRSGRLIGPTVLAVWVIAIAGGMSSLTRYSSTAGDAATPPVNWPRGTSIQRSAGRSTLLIFAHPQCPCTSATVEELAHLVAETREKLDVHVLFYAPEGESSDWVHGASWRNTAIIPGVQRLEDRNGVEVRRFHAATSGQVLLYDATGSLRFSGGITSARGHAGDNDGRDAIVSIALNGSTHLTTTPVFGCSLLGLER